MNKQTLKIIIFTGIFLTPFIPFLVSTAFFFPFIVTKAFAFRIIVEIVFAAWLLLAFADVNYRPKKSFILYAILIFLALIGLSDLLGVAPVNSFWSNFERMEGLVTLLHLGAFFIVIGSVFGNDPTGTEVNWKRWWNVALAASFVMVLYSLLQIIGLKVINQGGVRVDGTLGNAIYLAVYMLFHFFVALLFLYRERKNKVLMCVYGLLALFHVWILYYTATRGAILGLLGGLLVIAVLNIRNREDLIIKRASIVLLVGLTILVVGFWSFRDMAFINNSPVLSRFSSLTINEIKTQGRYFVWPIAFQGWKERPIFGWGQENFIYVFQEHYVPEMYNLEPWFDHAHNIFLDWAVAGGLLGLLSYLSLYVALLFAIWWRTSLSYTEKSILTGLIAAYFFHNFFVFDHLISYILFFSLLAYIYSLTTTSPLIRKEGEVRTKLINGIALPIISILLISSVYYVNVKPIITNFFLIKALQSVQTPGEMVNAIKYFKRAYSASHLGRSEVVERISIKTAPILKSDISMEDKNDFYLFAVSSIVNEVKNKYQEKNARSQLMTGSFLSTVGSLDDALVHLERAKQLMPNKQDIYLEIANAFLNKGDFDSSVKTLVELRDLSPTEKKGEINGYIDQVKKAAK